MGSKSVSIILPCLLFALIPSGVVGLKPSFGEYEVFAEWKEMVYSPDVDLSNFEPHNNILLGLKLRGPNEIYISIPRILPGIPSTLNKLVPNEDGTFMLETYPIMEMQTLGKYG